MPHATSSSPATCRFGRCWLRSTISTASWIPIQVVCARKRTSANEKVSKSVSEPEENSKRRIESEDASRGDDETSLSSFAPPSGPHCLLPAAEAKLLQMSAATSGFGGVPLSYAKRSDKPQKGWRSTWRAAAPAVEAEEKEAEASPAAAAAAAADPPSPLSPPAPSSKATLPPPTKNVARPAFARKATRAPFSRYPFPSSDTSSSTQQQQQHQIPVVYRSAPYRREAEREKSDFRNLDETFASSPSSLTPRVLFVDDAGGARARLAAALFASALAEAFPENDLTTPTKKDGQRLLPPLRVEFAAASVGPPARGPPDEAVVAAAARAGVSDFFPRGVAAKTNAGSIYSSPPPSGSSSPSPSSTSPPVIEEADLVRADLCLVCDRYDAEDLLRDAAALDGVNPGAFYSARIRKLSAFAPAASEWCDAARTKSRGRSGGRKVGNDRALPLLFLDPNDDIDDPLYGNISSSIPSAFLNSNDNDNDSEGLEEEESELSSALDATVAQLRLATRGLLQFLLKLEERRHRSNVTKTTPLPPPVLSLHASLRQAILCPLLSPEAERGGRGPAAAVSVLQAKAAGWRPVSQEETGEREDDDDDDEEDESSFPEDEVDGGGGGGGEVRSFPFLSLPFFFFRVETRVEGSASAKSHAEKLTRFPFLSLCLSLSSLSLSLSLST